MKNVFADFTLQTLAAPTLKEQLFEMFDAAYAAGQSVSSVGNALTSDKAAACYRTYWRRARGVSSARKERQAA